MSAVKKEARKLIDGLPENATWENVMYACYVRKNIDAGLAALRKGRVIPHERVKQRFLLRGR